MSDSVSELNRRQWAEAMERDAHVIVLPLTDSPEALVVDSYHPWNGLRAAEGVQDVTERLNVQRLRSKRSVRPRADIWYVGPWPANSAATRAIMQLSARYGPQATSLRVFYDECSDIIDGLNRFAGNSRRCRIQFCGRVPELTDEDVSNLVARGSTVCETAGWPIDGEPTNLERIAGLSEIGLRIPVAFYVSDANIDSIFRDAETCLSANLDAGVSFVAACEHPLFVAGDALRLPSAEEYCDVLVTAYERYRHFDDVMEPLVSLVGALRFGSCEMTTGTLINRRFRVDADGTTREFRQLPWVAAGVALGDSAPLVTASARACTACRWKHVCGGCDDSEEAVFQLICRYRMLFLEFLTREMHRVHHV